MRIIELVAQNIKKIRAITIRPDENIVQILGGNESGKTSTLDSILWALAGRKHIDMVPVRQGEERGLIRLSIGKADDVELQVIRTFKADGSSTLTLLTAAGAQFPKPQAKLDELFGSISLDPLEFARMKPAEMLDTLRKLTVLDVDLDALDANSAVDFSKRTEVNRAIRNLEERLRAMATIDLNATAVDGNPQPILDEIEKASHNNSAIEKEANVREALGQRIQARQRHLQSMEAEYARLRQRAQELAGEISDERDSINGDELTLHGSPPLPALIDVEPLRKQLSEAMARQAAATEFVSKQKEKRRLQDELNVAADRSKELTEQIEYRSNQKVEVLAAASDKLPVKGLGFDSAGVTLNGLPFSQASAAQQLRVSFAIAASMKPALPVVLIKDGSLLDDKSMALLAQMADEYGAQVWIERVGDGDVGFVLEDGEVVKKDGAPVSRQRSSYDQTPTAGRSI